MKKFLIFFMVMFGMACSAMADVNYLQTSNKTCAITPGASDNDMVYAVFFDTGIDKASPDCSDSFDTVKQELAKLNSRDIAYFVVVASADQQGDIRGYNNVALSGRRYDYVKNNILPSGIEVVKDGWIAGSASNKKFEPQHIDDWSYRGAYIYPVWARFTCDAGLVKGINDNISRLQKAMAEYPNQKSKIENILKNYNDAHTLCDTAGKKLGASDAEDLANLLNGAWLLVNETNITGITKLTAEITDIDLYYSNLSKLRDTLKVSEWRDEQGKFNTARLLSDSIAGVVLGTAGGLITSHLVKKNQLKKGFEDLNCSVGGQKVAGYGDDFRIGLQ